MKVKAFAVRVSSPYWCNHLIEFLLSAHTLKRITPLINLTQAQRSSQPCTKEISHVETF